MKEDPYTIPVVINHGKQYPLLSLTHCLALSTNDHVIEKIGGIPALEEQERKEVMIGEAV